MERCLQNHDAVTAIDFLANDAPTVFEALGLSPGENSPAHIKKQYHRISLLVHPDKTDLPNATEAFAVVSNAKDSLLDPEELPDLLLAERITGEVYERAAMAAATAAAEKAKDAATAANVEADLCDEEADAAKRAYKSAVSKANEARIMASDLSNAAVKAVAHESEVHCRHIYVAWTPPPPWHHAQMQRATTMAPCADAASHHHGTAAAPATITMAPPTPCHHAQMQREPSIADSWVKEWSTEHHMDGYRNTKTGGHTWVMPEGLKPKAGAKPKASAKPKAEAPDMSEPYTTPKPKASAKPKAKKRPAPDPEPDAEPTFKKPRGRPPKGKVWVDGEGYMNIPTKKPRGRPPRGKVWVDGKGWVTY